MGHLTNTNGKSLSNKKGGLTNSKTWEIWPLIDIFISRVLFRWAMRFTHCFVRGWSINGLQLGSESFGELHGQFSFPYWNLILHRIHEWPTTFLTITPSSIVVPAGPALAPRLVALSHYANGEIHHFRVRSLGGQWNFPRSSLCPQFVLRLKPHFLLVR